MPPGRPSLSATLLALLVLALPGSAAIAATDPRDDVSPALLLAEDLPTTLVSAMGVTHEPAFDYDQASFAANGGLDAAAQTWQATQPAPGDPVLIVFDFRFLFPDADAAQSYLDAAEPVLSESVTGITLRSDTPAVGEVLHHYAGSLSQGDLTIDVHNFLFRVGPVVGKVYVAGFGTTLDDALPLAMAAGGRTEGWLVARPAAGASPAAEASPTAGASPTAPSASGPATTTAPAGGGLRQWAIAATASSEFGSDSWSAARAVGPPDVEAYADDTDAWAPAVQNAGTEWLELRYEQAVIPTEIGIVETLGTGAVVRVEAWDAGSEAWVELWSGVAPPDIGEITTFRPPLAAVDLATDRIRLTLDTASVPGWNEIDAVELVGTLP
jgi:hypothetical protein